MPYKFVYDSFHTGVTAEVLRIQRMFIYFFLWLLIRRLGPVLT